VRRRLSGSGVTHVLIVRSTLERRLDPKFPNQLHYHIVEVPEGPTENLILYFTGALRQNELTPLCTSSVTAVNFVETIVTGLAHSSFDLFTGCIIIV